MADKERDYYKQRDEAVWEEPRTETSMGVRVIERSSPAEREARAMMKKSHRDFVFAEMQHPSTPDRQARMDAARQLMVDAEKLLREAHNPPKQPSILPEYRNQNPVVLRHQADNFEWMANNRNSAESSHWMLTDDDRRIMLEAAKERREQADLLEAEPPKPSWTDTVAGWFLADPSERVPLMAEVLPEDLAEAMANPKNLPTYQQAQEQARRAEQRYARAKDPTEARRYGGALTEAYEMLGEAKRRDYVLQSEYGGYPETFWDYMKETGSMKMGDWADAFKAGVRWGPQAMGRDIQSITSGGTPAQNPSTALSGWPTPVHPELIAESGNPLREEKGFDNLAGMAGEITADPTTWLFGGAKAVGTGIKMGLDNLMPLALAMTRRAKPTTSGVGRFTYRLPKDDSGELIDIGKYEYNLDVASPPAESTSLKFTPKAGWSERVPAPKEDGVIYRGMSEAEYKSFLETGEIKSQGRMNIGKAQEGLTYFSTSADNASGYATGVSTFDKNAKGYVVAIRDPGTAVNVHGTSHLEKGIPGTVTKDQVVGVYEGVPSSWAEGGDSVHAFWRRIDKPTTSGGDNLPMVVPQTRSLNPKEFTVIGAINTAKGTGVRALDNYNQRLAETRTAYKERGQANLAAQVDPEVGKSWDMSKQATVKEDFDGQVFLTADGMAGFALSKDGYVSHLFKHPDADFKGTIRAAITAARAAGAKNMDAFDTFLVRKYIATGSRETGRFPFSFQSSPEIVAALGPERPAYVSLDVGGVLDEYKFPKLIEPPQQVRVPKYEGRGTPEMWKKVFDDERQALVELRLDQGIEVGGEKWYWLGGMADSFMEVYGVQEGWSRFERLMRMSAMASAGSTPLAEIKRASVVYQRLARGEDPFLFNPKGTSANPNDLDPAFPPGYGHLNNQDHNLMLAEAMRNDPTNLRYPWTVGQKDKLHNYTSANLMNFENPPLDRHMWQFMLGGGPGPLPRGIPNMPTKNSPWVLPMEEALRTMGAQRGLQGAEAQSGVWVGAGLAGDINVSNVTNKTQLYNNAIARTAMELDIPEQEAWFRFMAGDTILYSAMLAIVGPGLFAAHMTEEK